MQEVFYACTCTSLADMYWVSMKSLLWFILYTYQDIYIKLKGYKSSSLLNWNKNSIYFTNIVTYVSTDSDALPIDSCMSKYW